MFSLITEHMALAVDVWGVVRSKWITFIYVNFLPSIGPCSIYTISHLTLSFPTLVFIRFCISASEVIIRLLFMFYQSVGQLKSHNTWTLKPSQWNMCDEVIKKQMLLFALAVCKWVGRNVFFTEVLNIIQNPDFTWTIKRWLNDWFIIQKYKSCP